MTEDFLDLLYIGGVVFRGETIYVFSYTDTGDLSSDFVNVREIDCL